MNTIFNKREFTLELAGKTLTAEFSNLAERANGSVLLRYGNTLVLATAVLAKQKKDTDFFPLTVEYEEKFYATGEILGSRFNRREGKPTDEATLSARIIDRTLRPLFDQWIRNEVQVIISVLSLEQDDADVLGVIAASLALSTSDIPWNGPVSAVRISKQKESDQFKVNPTFNERNDSQTEFELVVCGKEDKVNMIELKSKESTEELIYSALEKARDELERIQQFQQTIINELGKVKKHIPQPEQSKKLTKLITKNLLPLLEQKLFAGPGNEHTDALKSQWLCLAKEKCPEISQNSARELFEQNVNKLLHLAALKKGKRADGRGMDEIRPLYAQAGGVSPMLHGSGIFYRGGTHIFSALTLGGKEDALQVEGIEEHVSKHFIHHYNFPPFSTGDTGKIGSHNRRMIGHGALAEKALYPIIPSEEQFPYTIRIVSEAFSSNGSTSMASVCASTLALMDAGVPISRPVAGIAQGLMMESDTTYAILTDIQGPEDHHGDMDFKVAGTTQGITAIQLDVKVAGIPLFILKEALEKAKVARMKILEVITKEIAAPRKELSSHAPLITTITIQPHQIGLLIGSGGKTIKEIEEYSKVKSIYVKDDGKVYITGTKETAQEAIKRIKEVLEK